MELASIISVLASPFAAKLRAEFKCLLHGSPIRATARHPQIVPIPDLPIVFVAEHEMQVQQAQLELARIGFDQVVGFITADDLDGKQQITQLGARDFLNSLESP